MKFILVSPKNRTTYNFRGDLIRELQRRDAEVLVTGPDRENMEGIKALGVRFAEVPMHKNGTNPFADLQYKKALTKLFREEKPDAVLGYTIKPVVYGILAAKRAGVKNATALITGVGYTFIAASMKAKLLRFIVQTLYRAALKKANHVVFQNRDDLDAFVSRKLVRREKCSVVNGSGVNIGHFSLAPQPEGAVRFFMLSRLLKSKGVREYIAAARIVKAQCPEAQFALLGKYETAMQDAVAKEEVESAIQDGVIVRYEETNDVRPYYQDCSVYVLPSYSEGMPRTVLEAMATGRAILTTDANGCRDTVIDGKNGYLVPVKDSEALAEKMLLLAKNPALVAQMGVASRRLCEERFAVEKVNDALLRLMQLA